MASDLNPASIETDGTSINAEFTAPNWLASVNTSLSPTLVVNGVTVTPFGSDYQSSGDGIMYQIQPSANVPRINEGDTATITFPSGYLSSGIDGPDDGGTYTVNLRPLGTGNWRSFLPPFPLDDPTGHPRTMPLGQHPPVINGGTTPIYCNMIKTSQGWQDGGDGGTTIDANGHVTATNSGAGATNVICSTPDSFIGSPDGGVPCYPYDLGPYTIVWRTAGGAGTGSLSSTATGAIVTAGSSGIYASGPWAGAHWSQWSFAAGTSNKTGVNMQAKITGDADVLGVFPPWCNADGTDPKSDPKFLAMLPPGIVMRMTGFTEVNPFYGRDFADLNQDAYETYNGRVGWYEMQITAADAVASGSPQMTAAQAYFGPATQPLQLTTAGAHGLQTGTLVQINNSGGTLALTVDDTAHSGNAAEPWTPGTGYVVAYDATTLLFELTATQNDPINPGSVTLSGYVTVEKPKYGATAQDLVDLVNAVSGATLHLSIPVCWTDSAVDSMGDVIADASTGLAAGRKVIVELSNETWNTNAVFFYNHLGIIFEANRRGNGLTEGQMLAQRLNEVTSRVRARWAAAGRDPADVTMLFNTLAGGSSHMTDALAYMSAPTDRSAEATAALGSAVADPFLIDEVAISNYENQFDVSGGGDWLTAEHAVALAERYVKYHHWTKVDPSNPSNDSSAEQTVLAMSGYPDTKFVIYEGGPSFFGVVGSDLARAIQAQGAVFHPRFFDWFLWLMWGHQQDVGCARFTKAGLTNALANDATTGPGTGMYATYQSIMPPGRGDGSDGKADNLTEIATVQAGSRIPLSFRYDKMVSPIGAAIAAWLAPSTPTPTLTLSPTSQSLAAGATATVTVSLTGSSAALTASVDHGTLSTTAPADGTAITLADPFAGAGGTATITVVDSTDSITKTGAVTFAASLAPPSPHYSSGRRRR